MPNVLNTMDHTNTLSMLSERSIRYPDVYSPNAPAPNSHATYPPKMNPITIHTTDSMSASRGDGA